MPPHWQNSHQGKTLPRKCWSSLWCREAFGTGSECLRVFGATGEFGDDTGGGFRTRSIGTWCPIGTYLLRLLFGGSPRFLGEFDY